jgi:tetratricopeptide (TPR) repeat protein
MDIQQTMIQATEHLRAGRMAEAEALFRQVLTQQSDQADALHLVGCIASKSGRPEEAADFMRRAIQADPTKPTYHVNLGAVLLGMGKKEEAIPSFRAALAIRPDDLHTYYLLGNALCSVGKFDEAVPCFKWAVAAQPDYAPHHYNLGNCWLGKAVAIKREAVAERNQVFQQAVDCYERALAMRPSFREAGNNLATALQAMGRLNDAIAIKARIAKRAFLVLGPESCGNRFVTQCCIDAGCDGDAGHEQRFDKPEGLRKAKDVIVWRRSMPHGDEWPDLDHLLKQLRSNGYNDVRVLALLRTHYCAVRAQVHGNEKHVETYDEAERNISGALRRISSFILENNLPARWITYESIVDENQRESFKRVLSEWGLDATKLPEIKDENAKYLKDPILAAAPATRVPETPTETPTEIH